MGTRGYDLNTENCDAPPGMAGGIIRKLFTAFLYLQESYSTFGIVPYIIGVREDKDWSKLQNVIASSRSEEMEENCN